MLTILDLSEDSFTELPDLSALQNLVELNLAMNSLSLNLKGNMFGGEVPGEIAALVNLSDLDLSDNKLIGSFTNFTNIVNLDVSGNLEPIKILEKVQVDLIEPTIAIVVMNAIAVIITVIAFILIRIRVKRLAQEKRDARYDEDSFMVKDESQGIEMSTAGSVRGEMGSFVKDTKKLRITGQLEKGGFGIVYKARYEGKVVAVKV